MSISRVQINGNYSNGNAVPALSSATISVSQAFASNNTLGNTIMVLIAGSCNAAAGLGIGSPSVSDTQGNTYTQVGWLSGGTQSGGSIGLYMASNVHAGANTVTFSYTATCSAAVGGNFNAMVAIAEYSGMPFPVNTSHAASQFFGGAGGGPQTLSLTTSTSGTITVNFSAPGTDSCIFAADITVGAAEYIIAGSRTLNSSQAVPTSSAETFTQAIQAGSGDYLYYWDSGTPVATTQPVRGNIDWDQTGLDARQGNTYGRKFQYADGNFTAGNIPKFKNDGTLTDSTIPAPTGAIAQKYTTSWTSQTSVTVTHNLGTTDLLFQIFDSSGNPASPETVTFTDSNNLAITFGAAFTGRIVVIG